MLPRPKAVSHRSFLKQKILAITYSAIMASLGRLCAPKLYEDAVECGCAKAPKKKKDARKDWQGLSAEADRAGNANPEAQPEAPSQHGTPLIVRDPHLPVRLAGLAKRPINPWERTEMSQRRFRGLEGWCLRASTRSWIYLTPDS